MRHVCVSTSALWSSHPRQRFKDVSLRASVAVDSAAGRGITCFSLVPFCANAHTGAPDSGWLRSWDRSLKYTGKPSNSSSNPRASPQKKKRKKRAARRSTSAPSNCSSTEDEDSTNENSSSSQPRIENGRERSGQSSQASDVMLRNAGQESWESMELVPKRAGGRRSKKGRLKISKKLTPPRKRQQGKVTSQSVGDGGLYLVSGRAGVVQEGGPDSESRLAKHDVWQPEQATTPGETGEQVLKTTSSKLTGGLIAKLAVKIMRADGSIFVIRKSTATRSHAGEWQLPTAPLNLNTTPDAAMLNLCRGLLRPQSVKSGKKLVWEPSTFLCGKRLGRPQLVLIYEAELSENDIHPARAALRKKDCMWVSAAEYSKMEARISETLMKRSPWRIIWSNKIGRFTARPQLEAASWPERKAFCKEEEQGKLNHDYISLALRKDAVTFPNCTQRRILHVVSTAVWDKKAKKVLIASRWHRIDKRGRAVGRKATSPLAGKTKHWEERWEFPGGKVEAGETHVQAAVREMKEEMNLRIRVNDMHAASFETFPWCATA